MLTLRAVNAFEGDCLILTFGKTGDRHLLIDGGPKDTYAKHLRATLAALQPAKLTAVCLSHVDTDHALGLLDLLADLRDQDAEGDPRLVEIDDLWMNSFETTIDGDGGKRRDRLEAVLSAVELQAGKPMGFASAALNGIKHGHQLRLLAKQLALGARQKETTYLAGKTAPFTIDGVTFTVVGPTDDNLKALRSQWEDWLGRQEERIDRGRLDLAAMADKSVPNLSSIQLLVEEDGKRLLLTGDGRGDHLLEALEDADLLDADGRIEVDVLKVPHHGSDRNVTSDFFDRVRAATYVISANGLHGNPDLATLEWIYKAAKARKQKVEIVVTNQDAATEDLTDFVTRRPPDAVYALRARDAGANTVDVEL